MNKLILLKFGIIVLSGGFLFQSCSDDADNGNELFIRFKINGVQINYTSQSTFYAAFTTSGTLNNCVMTGYDATSNITLQAYDTVAVSEGIYTGYDITSAGSIYGALIGYENDNGVLFTQGSGSNHNTEVNILEITSSRVRGTFSGTLRASGQTDILITDGEFLVQRTN